MQIKLVEVTNDDVSWKGTWYRRGERHFVRQYADFPRVIATRWENIGSSVCGGIADSDCSIVRGPWAWLQCAAVSIADLLRLTESSRRRARIEKFLRAQRST
jgi:hypothetical protein